MVTFQKRDDDDDHEGAATAFFDTSEASRNICPWSCPWMQHAEYVSHLPKIKSPAAKTTVTEVLNVESGSSLSQIFFSCSSYMDLHLSDVTGGNPGEEEWAGRIFLTSQLM